MKEQENTINYLKEKLENINRQRKIAFYKHGY